jgi:hypothetical protein
MSLPSVTTMLSDGGVGFDMSHLPEEYSQRGTLIHLCAFCEVMGNPWPEVPEKWKGYKDALVEYFSQNSLETILAEPDLVHRFMGYQGHPDWFGKADMELSVRDYKTGSIPLYCGPQLAGYELLIKDMMPQYKESEFDHTAILLKPSGKYSLKTYSKREKEESKRKFLDSYYGYMERRDIKWVHRT